MALPPAFVKRIKRQVTAREHACFAVCAPGLEHLCADELARLSEAPGTIDVVPGGVAFTGRLTTLYLANLHLRTATRILMRLAGFRATRLDQIQPKMAAFPWELFLFRDMPVEIHVSSRHSRLYHRDAISERIEKSMRHRLMRHGAERTGPSMEQRLYLRLENDRATLSLDSSGPPLYKRGFKTHGARAPIRETLAAAILLWAGYRPGRPLVDPLCGGGTFSMEAALMALSIPPGRQRAFAFEGWPSFRPNHWQHLRREAHASTPVTTTAAQILASDREAAVCQALQAQLNRTGLEGVVSVTCVDFERLTPEGLPGSPTRGLVVINPPYGIRLANRAEARRLIVALGRHLNAHWGGWRVAVLLPDKQLARHFGRPLSLRPLKHGGLSLTLMIGDLPPKPSP